MILEVMQHTAVPQLERGAVNSEDSVSAVLGHLSQMKQLGLALNQGPCHLLKSGGQHALTWLYRALVVPHLPQVSSPPLWDGIAYGGLPSLVVTHLSKEAPGFCEGGAGSKRRNLGLRKRLMGCSGTLEIRKFISH